MRAPHRLGQRLCCKEEAIRHIVPQHDPDAAASATSGSSSNARTLPGPETSPHRAIRPEWRRRSDLPAGDAVKEMAQPSSDRAPMARCLKKSAMTLRARPRRSGGATSDKDGSVQGILKLPLFLRATTLLFHALGPDRGRAVDCRDGAPCATPSAGNPPLALLGALPALALFPLAYGALGLYPGVLLQPARRAEKDLLGTSLIFSPWARAPSSSRVASSIPAPSSPWLGCLRWCFCRCAGRSSATGSPAHLGGATRPWSSATPWSAGVSSRHSCVGGAGPSAPGPGLRECRGRRSRARRDRGHRPRPVPRDRGAPGLPLCRAGRARRPPSELAALLETTLVRHFRKIILVPDLMAPLQLWASAVDFAASWAWS